MNDITVEALEVAYWAHIEAYGKNAPFVYENVRYSRSVEPIKSKSGKSTVGWNVIYHAEDGSRCTGPKLRKKDCRLERE